jgi:hypothetical protein
MQSCRGTRVRLDSLSCLLIGRDNAAYDMSIHAAGARYSSAKHVSGKLHSAAATRSSVGSFRPISLAAAPILLLQTQPRPRTQCEPRPRQQSSLCRRIRQRTTCHSWRMGKLGSCKANRCETWLAVPHLHRDLARPCRVCIGTALVFSSYAPGLRSPILNMAK